MGVSGMGTTFIIQNIDISDLQIDKGGQVKYTIEVDKQDAQDRIYMHVTGITELLQSFQALISCLSLELPQAINLTMGLSISVAF